MRVYIKEQRICRGNAEIYDIVIRQEGYLEFLEETETEYTGFLTVVKIYKCSDGYQKRIHTTKQKFSFPKDSDEILIIEL
ncbi:hypothetical protein GBBBJNDB_00206 [Pseudomonas phage Callisto]|nr:hypothetical protein GBBBJNDB_00206 [Pseudomonas phage Callisto]